MRRLPTLDDTEEPPPFEVVLGSSASPCDSCPHFDYCERSTWNESRAGQPERVNMGDITSVHTCRTCGDKALTGFRDQEYYTKRVVSDDCPRWDNLHSNGTDCGGCNLDRKTLQQEDPRYPLRLRAAREFGGILHKLITDDVSKEEREREMRRICRDFATSITPSFSRTADYTTAQRLVGLLVADLNHQEPLADSWSQIPEVDRTGIVYDWLDLFHRISGRGSHAVFRAFMLTLTDRGWLARAWTQIDPDQRTLIRHRWEAMISSTLGEDVGES